MFTAQRKRPRQMRRRRGYSPAKFRHDGFGFEQVGQGEAGPIQCFQLNLYDVGSLFLVSIAVQINVIPDKNKIKITQNVLSIRNFRKIQKY